MHGRNSASKYPCLKWLIKRTVWQHLIPNSFLIERISIMRLYGVQRKWRLRCLKWPLLYFYSFYGTERMLWYYSLKRHLRFHMALKTSMAFYEFCAFVRLLVCIATIRPVIFWDVKCQTLWRIIDKAVQFS